MCSSTRGYLIHFYDFFMFELIQMTKLNKAYGILPFIKIFPHIFHPPQ